MTYVSPETTPASSVTTGTLLVVATAGPCSAARPPLSSARKASTIFGPVSAEAPAPSAGCTSMRAVDVPADCTTVALAKWAHARVGLMK